jgi:non-ribosomal peptide synthetase component E (peptide arylation enzyme)
MSGASAAEDPPVGTTPLSGSVPVTSAIGVRHAMPGVVYPPLSALQTYVASGALGQETLPQAFRQAMRTHARRIAVCGPEGSLSYAELDQRTDRVATGLLALGLRPLDRVLFQMANCPEVLVCLIACLKAGLIPVCTLAPHREREIGHLARHSAAVLHIVRGDDPRFDEIGFAHRMQAEAPSLRLVLQTRGVPQPGAVQLTTLMESTAPDSLPPPVEVDPFQVAVFQLSGGTSGVPKIIPRFHNDYLCHMRAVASACGFGAQDRVFNPLPMMHNLNLGCFFMPALLSGAAVCIAPDMNNATLAGVFRDWRPTWTMLTDPILVKLQAEIASGEVDFRHLRGIVGPNSAPKLRTVTGAAAFHIFGMTEGVITFTRPGDPQEALDQTVGRPVHAQDEIRIVRPGSRTPVAQGEMGEAQFRGPYTIHGYYDAPERNAEAFTDDGWYCSGDLMSWRVIEGHTYYTFQGRTKDVVDRGGEKISAEEVEWACNAHPAVGAAGVVAMPDPVLGEKVCVFVVLKPGHRTLGVQELGRFLQAWGMARYKWPERVECIDHMPLTQSGKMSKPDLRTLLAVRLKHESQERP